MNDRPTHPDGTTDAPHAEPAPASADALSELKAAYIRLQADTDNMRKRAARELDTARQRERERILRGFLEVYDNFDRALAATGAEGNQWLSGMEGIRVQMLEQFRRFGAAPMDCTGQTFDPMAHEAVATVNLPDQAEGTITEIVQQGFLFDDGTVLRPAKVIVVRHG